MPIYSETITQAADELGGLRRLSPFTVAALNNVFIEYLGEHFAWETRLNPLSQADIDDLDARLALLFLEVNINPMLGAILPFATDVLPDGVLACDGASYLRTDWPELYAALGSVYQLDADNFIVPDLRSRVIAGVGNDGFLTPYNLNDSGGLEQVTLVTAEIPSHTHADTGHTHVEGTATPAVVTIGAGAPAPTAVPGVGVTGVGNAALANTGGDNGHENRQPFVALTYGIVAQ